MLKIQIGDDLIDKTNKQNSCRKLETRDDRLFEGSDFTFCCNDCSSSVVCFVNYLQIENCAESVLRSIREAVDF